MSASTDAPDVGAEAGAPSSLPALEVDRRLDDWGASPAWRDTARRRALEPLWRVWLRAEARGLHHLPRAGGALLAVHAAGPPWLALALVAHAAAEHVPGGREPVIAVDPGVARRPALGVPLARLGAFPAVPANVERRLRLEHSLVVVAGDEGGADRGLGRATEVGALRRELLAAAHRAEAPVVPVVVAGLARAAPALGRPRLPLVGRVRLPLPLVDPRLTPPLLPARVVVVAGPPVLVAAGADGVQETLERTGAGLRALVRARHVADRWRA